MRLYRRQGFGVAMFGRSPGPAASSQLRLSDQRGDPLDGRRGNDPLPLGNRRQTRSACPPDTRRPRSVPRRQRLLLHLLLRCHAFFRRKNHPAVRRGGLRRRQERRRNGGGSHFRRKLYPVRHDSRTAERWRRGRGMERRGKGKGWNGKCRVQFEFERDGRSYVEGKQGLRRHAQSAVGSETGVHLGTDQVPTQIRR